MNHSRLAAFCAWGALSVAVIEAAAASATKPLALHPENPHYFLFRGKPAILISSAEHYGAVLNLDFNYVRYLDELKSKGLNHTRTFTGAYVEPAGAFNIAGNTLAPAPYRFICPWARSATPGYGNGGNKFDLRRWDETYFKRLKDFVAQAGKRDVIVELNLFCPFYDEAQWRLSPQNITNNVNNLGNVARTNVYTLDKHDGLLEVHEAMVRKIVTDLKDFDNLYYEICNEPYFGGVTMEWQHHIAEVIAETEKTFRHQHLTSMNIANNSAKVQNPHSAVSIYNFHYASPPTAVALNYPLGKVIGDNETGFRGTNDLPYRVEAWDFILAGGALFSHLDYSFVAGHEDGTFNYSAAQPGGGNPSFRKQMTVLKDFIHGFDFVNLKPDSTCLKRGIPVGTTARALVEPGKAYAVYIGPTQFAKDQFSVRWSGKILPKFSETYTFHTVSNDGVRLFIDGKPVIDNWTEHSDREDRGTIALRSGQQYDLRLEYFQSGGGAAIKLFWSSPAQPKEIIPESQLFYSDGKRRGLQARYYNGKNFDVLRFSRTDFTVDFDWTNSSPFADSRKGAGTNVMAELVVEIPSGSYVAEWLNTRTGKVDKQEAFQHEAGLKTLVSAPFDEDIALRINAAEAPKKKRPTSTKK